jgi:hypothetical protein
MPVCCLLALLLLSLVAGGCAPGEPASVLGHVVYAGEPVADGSLRLFPLADTPGVGAEAAIRDGQYAVALEQGLLAGRYRIEVRATGSIGPVELPSEEIDGTPPPQELRYEIIPERYNDASTLELELKPGENRRNLDLQRDAQWEAQRQDEIPDWVREAAKKG